jgi:3',5'-cyclic AMP phosphodiesterase CpdA
MSIDNKSRRSFLRNTLAAATGAAIIPNQVFAQPPAIIGDAKKFRVVQITDSHVKNELSASHSRAVLERIARDEKPDLIFHTGDVIMDALDTGKEDVGKQWALWKQITAGFNVPIKYTLGNHDVWWNKPDASEPLFGKSWALQELGMPKRYYSLAAGGWKFIFLDSIQPHETTKYSGGIDREQMDWLTHELTETSASTPVLLCSHIPVLSAAIFDLSEKEKDVWQVSGSLMHSDSHEVQSLFRTFPNVHACLSGHLHLLDTVRYDKIQYMGCGAVCANWWKTTSFHQTIAGYAVLDLKKDGTVNREYKAFPWG